MDTKLKNYKSSMGFKALCIILSIVMMGTSIGLLTSALRGAWFYNDDKVFLSADYIKTKSFTDSDMFIQAISSDLSELQDAVMYSSYEKQYDYVCSQKNEQIEKEFKRFQGEKATRIYDILYGYASRSDWWDINAGSHNVPEKELKHIIDVDENAPKYVRDIQKIINGTEKGLDFLQYESLAREIEDLWYEESDYRFDIVFSVKYKGEKLRYNEERQVWLGMTDSDVKESLNSAYNSFAYQYDYSDNYTDAQYRLGKIKNLQYYVKNNDTGVVVSNLPKDSKPSDPASCEVTFTYLNSEFATNLNVINHSIDAFQGVYNITAYVGLNTDLPEEDDYYEIKEIHNSLQKQNLPMQLVFAVLLCILSLVLFIIALTYCGHKKGYEGIKLAWIDKVPTDLHFVITTGLIVGIMCIFVSVTNNYNYPLSSMLGYFMWIPEFTAVLAVGIWAVFTEFCHSFIRVCKSDKKLYKNCLIWWLLVLTFKIWRWFFRKIINGIKKLLSALSYSPKHYKRNMIIVLVFYVLINIIVALIAYASRSWFVVLLFAAGNSYCIWYAMNYLIRLDKIITAAHDRTDPCMDTQKLPQSLRVLAESLRYTNDELQNAVTKAIKDERLKTELITNVSHDLKTPLTSIISYVDLLSKCDIDDEKAKEYIGVLDEKGKKLKRLIDDLIEASKVSSGNITLNKVSLNMNELAVQAIVESQSDFEKNNLTLIFDDSSKSPIVFADGSKTYRVFENLLSNACKYSAKGSRVYSRVYEENGMGVFEIKNISAEPLNISTDELTERFVRGDESRAKDGNGLGLSIAKELCTIQDGRLALSIDGDLFKAKVYISKYTS